MMLVCCCFSFFLFFCQFHFTISCAVPPLNLPIVVPSTPVKFSPFNVSELSRDISTSLNGCHVLLVKSCQAIAEVCGKQLTQRGMKITYANSPDQAREIVRDSITSSTISPFDLFLIDYDFNVGIRNDTDLDEQHQKLKDDTVSSDDFQQETGLELLQSFRTISHTVCSIPCLILLSLSAMSSLQHQSGVALPSNLSLFTTPIKPYRLVAAMEKVLHRHSNNSNMQHSPTSPTTTTAPVSQSSDRTTSYNNMILDGLTSHSAVATSRANSSHSHSASSGSISSISLTPSKEMAKHFPLKILVAEDNSVNQKIVCAMLTRLGKLKNNCR